jgi:hypothetical protein
MGMSNRALTTAAAAAAAALALAVGALGAAASDGHGHGEKGKSEHGKHHGKHHGQPVLKASLAPSHVGDPAFHGVSAGGAPWVLKRGEVRIKRSDRLDLRVKGLVIPNPPGDGTPGPVNTISASLYCGADSNTTAADTSKQVPISRKGNARIRDRSFDVPDTCLAPVVLVHPNGNTAVYIAVDGWRLEG